MQVLYEGDYVLDVLARLYFEESQKILSDITHMKVEILGWTEGTRALIVCTLFENFVFIRLIVTDFETDFSSIISMTNSKYFSLNNFEEKILVCILRGIILHWSAFNNPSLTTHLF